jgi:hypothetical protein
MQFQALSGERSKRQKRKISSKSANLTKLMEIEGTS